jgi:hypothetical protein
MTRSTLAVILAAVLMATGTASAQTARQQARAARGDDTIAALTAEVRALRAELAATARTSLRLQLLTARIQAQEQRIIYLDRQRAEAATRRSGVEQARNMIAGQLRQFTGNELEKLPAEDRRQFEFMVTQQKEQLALQDRNLQQLQLEETDAANALAQEQARWDEFNNRLEELERSLK